MLGREMESVMFPHACRYLHSIFHNASPELLYTLITRRQQLQTVKTLKDLATLEIKKTNPDLIKLSFRLPAELLELLR